jgi:hypothetical protein
VQLRQAGCSSRHLRVEIRPKRYGHGEPPSFATLNQPADDLKSRPESQSPGHGIKTRLALTPCRRATSANEAPSIKLSSTIRCFSSAAQYRRLRPTGSPSLLTDLMDNVYYRIVDTIIEPILLDLPARFASASGTHGGSVHSFPLCFQTNALRTGCAAT